MTVSHATGTRNAIADAVDDQVNAGATDAQGDMVVIDSAGPTDLVEFNLQDPAFGAAASGQITLQGTPIQANAAAAGTADTGELRDKDNNQVLSGTVTATGGGGDWEIDNTSIEAGQQVNLQSTSYTAPP